MLISKGILELNQISDVDSASHLPTLETHKSSLKDVKSALDAP